jgi:hypothetical protein
MDRNNGSKSRTGAVKSRSQVLNAATGHYIKRDVESGQFLSVKSDKKPYKGIRIEKSNIKASPNIDFKIAAIAERAVMKVKNSMMSSK